MDVVRDISAVRAAVAEARRAGRRIGLVPTMGALHRGHVSLIEAARRDETFIVVSIFVNPTQFGPGEDYERYPRPEQEDLRICEEQGTDVVFAPPAEVMYPRPVVTTVHVGRLTETLCGPHRPGHFDGVATVVAKLLHIVGPDSAYFGQKDYQQLQVIRRMVADLDEPVEIVGCPTVREEDGLALSSRNAYLSPEQRVQARSVWRALQAGRERVQGGEREAAAVVHEIREIVLGAGPAEIDYIELVEPETLQPVTRIEGSVVAALAVRIGGTRLIDNLLIEPG